MLHQSHLDDFNLPDPPSGSSGIRQDLRDISMICARHGAPLKITLATSEGEADSICCGDGCSFPILGGIPRFVDSEHYASSFGLQWKTFRRTQLDSCNGTTISRDRLTRLLGGDLGVLKGKNVLEAGCGAGRFTEIMLQAGANVFACDISSAVEANFENCRPLQQGANYFVCQADLRKIPVAPEQFDVVVCVGVIQHTPDPEETMAALCGYVKPGGMLVIDHYTHGYPTTRARAALRKLLLQVPAESALEFCQEMVELYWPVHEFSWQNRNDPTIGALRQSLLELSPIVDYHEAYPTLRDELKSWALLDTHDTLTDRFKHLRSAEEIGETLAAHGMIDLDIVPGGNGIEARGWKKPAPALAELPSRKTRILIVAWGYSIHARRRIQTFIDDPRFEVAVASNHDYGFPGARNVLLDGASQNSFAIDHDCEELRFAEDYAARLGVADLSPYSREICVGLHDFRILRHLVRDFDPNVMLLQTLLYPCYLALFLERSLPYLVTFWNGDVTWWAQYDGIERDFKKLIVSEGALNAAAVTVNSQKAFEACLDYGVPRERINLIRYPGADLKRFCLRDGLKAKESLGLAGRKVVLCPRGLGSYLNADVIVEAAGIVCKKHPEVLFLFVSGVGAELWEGLLARGEELGVARQLRHDGQVEWERMPDYQNAADVMVSVSSKDSLPNCMLESMASQTPVVMGDIPPIRDWVTDGVTGFLVPPREAELLAARIREVLYGDRAAVAQVVANALALVTEEANGAVNNERMRALALGVAHGARGAAVAPAPGG